MSSLRSGVNTDEQIRNGAWSERMKESAKLGLLSAALLVGILLFAAESADDIKLPVGYRNWFHVNTMIVDKASPLFEGLGGMHNVYVNSTGEAALKKGVPYPNGAMFVTDLHEFTVSDGSYVEGARKALAAMVKDSKKYASTGGWGSVDLALKDAFRKMRAFLMSTKGLTEDEAISLMSIAVDFGITQVVDGNWGVHAVVKKSLFAGAVA